MRSVAEGLVSGMFAHAKPSLAGLFRRKFVGAEFGSLVRSIAEGLRLRASAGAKVVEFSFFKIDLDRRISGYNGLVHWTSLFSRYQTKGGIVYQKILILRRDKVIIL
jgi:hypothetical protein